MKMPIEMNMSKTEQPGEEGSSTSRGKTIKEIQDLDKKLDLLRAKREIDAIDPRNVSYPLITNTKIAAKIKHADPRRRPLSGADISHALERRELSSAYLPSLLGLFGLSERNGVPRWIDPDNDDHKRWIDLLKEPVEAFSARVRLLGGESYAAPPGGLWDKYFKPRITDAEKAARDRLAVYDIEKPLPTDLRTRALPPGALNPVRERPAMPELFAYDHVRFHATLGPALSPRVSPMYVLAFHDVTLPGSRYFVPLFPSPAIIEVEPLGENVAAACFEATIVSKSELSIPDIASDPNHLVVPQNWGEIRTVVMVISSKPFDEEIVAEATSDWQIRAETLDLLAARLLEPGRRYGRDHALWRLSYRVVEH